ncbi:10513_t:CDS:2 [Entrophospora sp. SA101]|nr:10513_t:CDS:2 [Entrophospora sp. SA101]
MVASDTHDTSLNTSDVGMDLNEHPSSGIEPKVESKVKVKTESIQKFTRASERDASISDIRRKFLVACGN